MKRWMKYGVIFILGGLSALGFDNSGFLPEFLSIDPSNPLFRRFAAINRSKMGIGYNTSQSVISGGAAATSSGIGFGEGEDARVARVIDGDTIELIDKRKVRYIGIDTPEMVEPDETKPGFSNSKAWLWKACFAREAKEENQRLVEGKIVRLEKDISQTDKYGRLLRYVYVDDVFVNDYLVRQGFAQIDTVPPDVVYKEQFLIAQREARNQARGLWKSCPTN